MSRPILEVIALCVDDAVAAEAGGADRLELVTDMASDGLTPSLETFTAVREAVRLPVRVMLRAADGFAAGDAAARATLRDRAAALRAAGADEFVLGFLDPTAGPDLGALRSLLDVLHTCRWTFHRAIDHAPDRAALRKAVGELPGLDTYLTAGAAAGVGEGLYVLRDEAARAAAGEPGYEPRIMAGGGLRLEHVPVLRAAGIDAFHIGGAARLDGWTSPVAETAVREWRTALDT
ncbi:MULTISPECIES: copper homeostasis protein CutC [unclassified Streptomyces]|uniref:copper homeostasis protein CutC n=1 Tax=unclassified Streptomyces TaxID=2593676 RepID=UPI0022B6B817|nr:MULTISPECIES: copper homeostasis protein CutC [unclassified Streptomyces]MCZ7414913.1 copper homeostasis protein CutC [Streptomyces sp. WMMC897]MCZ7431856.1 copper homeostasis protein CutC [Streptomyces sp. WMMC1477]